MLQGTLDTCLGTHFQMGLSFSDSPLADLAEVLSPVLKEFKKDTSCKDTQV